MKESRHIWPSYMKRVKKHCSIKHDMITTFSLQFPSLEKDGGYSNIYKNFRINISNQKFLIIYHQLPCIKTFSDVIIHVTIEMKVFLRTVKQNYLK